MAFVGRVPSPSSWRERLVVGALGGGHRLRIAASVASIAAVTGVVRLASAYVPELSLGVLYVFAVLPVAVLFGLGYAVSVAVGSMLAFNWFFLPPVHTFRLAEPENWSALAVYLVTAVVVSELAVRARRQASDAEQRARDASLLADAALQREQLARATVETDALRRSDSIKTAVLQAVSHDLRSPLTAISAAAGGLAEQGLDLRDSDRAELLSTITTESARLNRLVSNLLDLSRLQAHASHPQPELWTVDELVAQALEEVGPEAEDVVVSLADELLTVRADGEQVQRALVNLIENALKFSPRAGTVRVGAARASGEVRIRVGDRGPGVADVEKDRIFEPFHRSPETDSVGGAGLGLPIARGFAEANAGRVWVESRAGGGSTFCLALPDPAVEAET